MKLVINSPVEHDGKALEVGDSVDLPKQFAEALIAVGAAAETVGKSKAKAEPADEPAEA